MIPNDRVLVFLEGRKEPYSIIRFLRSRMVSHGLRQTRTAVFWSSLMKREVCIRENTCRKLHLNDQEFTITIEHVNTDRVRAVFRADSQARFTALNRLEEP